MASPERQLASESDDVVDKSDDISDMLSEVQVEDSQLQHVVDGDEDLSQIEGQEAVSETQIDSHEPGSAKADEGMVMDTVDGTVSHEPHGNATDSDDQVHSDGVTLLRRPDSAGKSDLLPAFSFGRVSRLSMDLTGTRKGPASSTVANTEGK